MKASKALLIAFWTVTILLALEITFTAYAQLRLPQVAAEFDRLGFPGWFRVELSWAKFAGVAALLIPAVPARVKEWAYAGFAVNLVSAIIAHLAVGDGPAAWSWAAGTFVLWVLSYVCWRRLSAPRPASAPRLDSGTWAGTVQTTPSAPMA
jgi:O-antigen/teichoic acid export membrane protein